MTQYKKGDRITIEIIDPTPLNNHPIPAHLYKIINHEPSPFDWSTVKAGMAFKFPQGVYWYVGADLKDKECGVFAINAEWDRFSSFCMGNAPRCPERDIHPITTK